MQTFIDIRGQGQPIIFIHGVLVDNRMWDYQIASISQRYKTIRYDLLGHGKTANPSGTRDLQDFVNQLNEVIKSSCKGVKPIVVGFSMGGLIAQSFSIQESPKIKGLVLMSTIYDRSKTEQDMVQRRLKNFKFNGMKKVIEEAKERWFSKSEQQKFSEDISKTFRLMESGSSSAKLKAYSVFASDNKDIVDQLSNIDCPCLIITGSKDVGSTPLMAAKMANEISGSECKILKDQRHMISITYKYGLNKMLESFFEKNSHKIQD